MAKFERLVSAFQRRRAPATAGEGAVSIGGGRALTDASLAGARDVDVSEFVAVSESLVDPVALATRFEEDMEASLSDHRLTREQLETPLTV